MTGIIERLAAALSDRYRIGRELGRGGMATVFAAQDIKLDRKVALKVLNPELAAAIGAERFLNEIRVTANLQHPHILALYDSGQADGLLYYVMPFVDGESLRERLDREEQLPVQDAVRIAHEVAEALQHAHTSDMVHRDIKPENILLSGGHALVADFGVARAVRAAGGERLTRTGIAVGTPIYMSPEQATAHERIDARSDLYSLGCVLYEMLAGEAPLVGRTFESTVARRLTETPRPLRSVRETVPVAIEAVVNKALAKLPADRFASAEELVRALEGASGASSSLSPTRLAPPSGARTVSATQLALGGGLFVAATPSRRLAGCAARHLYRPLVSP